MRTFIAVDIPESEYLKDLYKDFKENLKGVNIKYTNLQSLHITLAFLGETNLRQSSAIIKHLKNYNQNFQPFKLDLESVGYFGKKSSPSVIWIGVKPSPPLLELYNFVNGCLAKVNIETEKREFSPHLTIGRIKFSDQGNNLHQLVQSISERKFGSVLIDKFVFYESILQPSGPLYKPLETFYFR